jgi:hypothetical protein
MSTAWAKQNLPLTPECKKLHELILTFTQLWPKIGPNEMTAIKNMAQLTTQIQAETVALIRKQTDAKIVSNLLKVENSVKLVRNAVTAMERNARTAAELAKRRETEIVAMGKTIEIAERKLKDFGKKMSQAVVALKKVTDPKLRTAARDRMKQDYDRFQKDGLTHKGQDWETYWRATMGALGKLADKDTAKIDPLSKRLADIIKARDAIRSYAKGAGVE